MEKVKAKSLVSCWGAGGEGRGTQLHSNLPLLPAVRREGVFKFRQFVFPRALVLQGTWFREKTALIHCLAPEDVGNSSSSSASAGLLLQ